MTTAPAPAHWSADALAGIAAQADARLPVFTAQDVVPILPDHDLWDMWQIAYADGRTALFGGRSWWFFLATPRFDDPDLRHDEARIRLTSHGADGWRDHGVTFADGFTPGSREWSGSAVLGEDDTTLTMYFTASGRRGGARTFEQRLFETQGRFILDGDAARCEGWTTPVESVAADGHHYIVANQAEPENGGIKGFRDPGYFRDPADGSEYLLFVGSAGWVEEAFDGVIGVARRVDGQWVLQPPLIEALDVNSELERPHIILRNGLYYCFWSTQAKRFAPGLSAPTGLYAMVADRLSGPWRLVNGTGLVAGNPDEEPMQAYCWWVTGEGDVISFVDFWDLKGADVSNDPALRRRHFGGTAAPWFRLAMAGDRVTIAQG
ncbi:glycoside hydrolase 68 family protein [Sphingomonas paucimobilis]|uniref:Glycoside hydrolase family 68 protein n=2 Tax=Sphingomonas paucimobilis TaxID=13689 RepID=A0A411LH01_SPHPI|nr:MULTISPECIES: glycoside hydrolase family 68 protein [Sphingomonas]MBQ1479207.1 glycoside hydrolase family 68 protein [Sphingomonas sp.]MCM3677770.1 glycoside hydrolase family 68 protein [Sphingomonas paucimobilis]MDG5972398.1 glycoside hydrolase family 68 protein [Sphingomonas paucimobilis]NNG57624.1 glycoside hydrolase family 68 protein [Sphingomonas paucimobilis]QBE91650.1 glycoside hydrolase family 68 protein [Sphingomonas paucimobilis]